MIPTQPSNTRVFDLFYAKSEQSEDVERYTIQFKNEDGTFDLYEIWHQQPESMADFQEIKLNSSTPYKSSAEEKIIPDHQFLDFVISLPLIRLIFELADPDGNLDLETDGDKIGLAAYPGVKEFLSVRADIMDGGALPDSADRMNLDPNLNQSVGPGYESKPMDQMMPEVATPADHFEVRELIEKVPDGVKKMKVKKIANPYPTISKYLEADLVQEKDNLDKLEIEAPEEFGPKFKGQLEQMAEEHGLGDLMGYALLDNYIIIWGEEATLQLTYSFEDPVIKPVYYF